MTERQRQVRINIAAFLLLFFVSLYRQVSNKYRSILIAVLRVSLSSGQPKIFAR